MKQQFDLVKDCSQKILAIIDTMEILNGKWKTSTIDFLCYKPIRYSELLKEVKGISGKMHSCKLKYLKINKLIDHHIPNTVPIAVEYQITDYDKSLQ